MKAEAETMIAAAKVEGEQIKRKGAEQVVSNTIFNSSLGCLHQNFTLFGDVKTYIKMILCTTMLISTSKPYFVQ